MTVPFSVKKRISNPRNTLFSGSDILLHSIVVYCQKRLEFFLSPGGKLLGIKADIRVRLMFLTPRYQEKYKEAASENLWGFWRQLLLHAIAMNGLNRF